jgi:probable rRNA maturation factor
MTDDPDERRRAKARRRLQVTVTDGAGHPARAPGLARWLAATAPRRAAGEVAVALVGDRRVRELNRTYRGVDRTTDVLSFPADGAAETHRPSPSSSHLGDIVIATGLAQRQARAAGHGLGTELRVLALHGLLHLLGYDHERDGGRMARVERRLRRAGGLREGLIERGGVRR